MSATRCPEKYPRELSPRKNFPPEHYPPPRKNASQKNCSRKNAPRKIVLLVLRCSWHYLNFWKLFTVTMVTNFSNPCNIYNGSLCNICHKNSILDVAGGRTFASEFIRGIFQRHLSVKHTGQLVTHGKTESCKVCLLHNNFP